MNKNLTVGILAAASLAAPLSAQFMSSLNPAIDLNSFGIVENSGIVVEILGANGAHVVAQIGNLELYNGFFDYGTGGGIFANNIFGYTGDANMPIPFTAGLLGIMGESYGWDAFDFGGSIAGINIEMTMFDFQGGNNPGEDYLMVNGVDAIGVDLGILGFPVGAAGTLEILGGSTPFDGILFDLENSGILNFAMFETNPDVYTYGGYTPVDFVGADLLGQGDNAIASSRTINPIQVTAPIPEPSFIALISFGFLGTLLGTYRRRR